MKKIRSKVWVFNNWSMRRTQLRSVKRNINTAIYIIVISELVHSHKPSEIRMLLKVKIVSPGKFLHVSGKAANCWLLLSVKAIISSAVAISLELSWRKKFGLRPLPRRCFWEFLEQSLYRPTDSSQTKLIAPSNYSSA